MSAELHTVPGVELFATGEAHGRAWSESDIDAMIRNAALLADYLQPTVVIGHEDHQPLTEGLPATAADNTGNPAFGVIGNLRKDVQTIEGVRTAIPVGDFYDVPGWLAELIDAKAYRAVSAEVYEEGDPPDGVPANLLVQIKGPVLKRVALLGGELPRWKTLAGVPRTKPQDYSERRSARLVFSGSARTKQGTTLLFADLRTREERPMVATSKFADVIRRRVKTRGPITDRVRSTLKRFSDTPADALGKPSLVERADMIAALADYGVEPSVLSDGVPDAFLAESLRVLQQINPTAPEDNRSSHGPPAASNESPDTQFGERQKVKAAVEKYADANPRIFEVTRRNPASIVRTFCDVQARKPGYTAAEFVRELGI